MKYSFLHFNNLIQVNNKIKGLSQNSENIVFTLFLSILFKTSFYFLVIIKIPYFLGFILQLSVQSLIIASGLICTSGVPFSVKLWFFL